MKYVTVIIEAISKLLVLLMAYLKGRTDVQNKQLKEDKKAIEKKASIRRRIKSDPDYARKLRKKYTR